MIEDNEKFGDMSPYGVRLPRELKARIKALAKENKQTMHAAILQLIEKSIDDNEDEKLDKIEGKIDGVDEKLDEVLKRLDTKA